MHEDGNDAGSRRRGPSRLALVGLRGRRGEREWAEHLAELDGLVRSAGGEVVTQVLQNLQQPDPRSYVGSGSLDHLATAAREAGADAVLAADSLTPLQARTIGRVTELGVVDRTQLILDLFAQRARSTEGRVQVEAAQLRYFLPRLAGHGGGLSRQAGGIGTRGPGESKLELDRRRIRVRLRELKAELEGIRQRRERTRARREDLPLVAAVGYTNVGKTSLVERLSGDGDLGAQDMLFATLDPTVRRVVLPGHEEVRVVDTVGFVREMPPEIVEAFHATLEEVGAADLLLHVVDAAHPDWPVQAAAVERVLAAIGADRVPRVLVMNRIDLVAYPEAVAGAELVSARTGAGIAALKARMQAELGIRRRQAHFLVPFSHARLLSLAHQHGRVLREEATAWGTELDVEMDSRWLGVLEKALAAAGGR